MYLVFLFIFTSSTCIALSGSSCVSQKCYEKVKTFLGSTRVLWTRDGKNGPDDPTTSMSILIKWLTTETNYSKYRGGGNGSASSGKGRFIGAPCSVKKFRMPE